MTDSAAMIATQRKPVLPSKQDADGWLTPLRFAAVLAVLMVVTFPGVLMGQETFFQRDFCAFGYPLAFFHRQAFWRGEMPLWNPYNSCGLPFLAQWNTLTLYPPSLFYLLFPLSWSLGVFNLAHMFLAGMGMYFLAHRWSGNRLAASVAGIVYAFNGLTWYALMWPNDIAALGWMPWVVLSVQRAWQEGGARKLAAAGLVGTMQMLSGAPEIIFLTWIFLSAMWLGECVVGTVARGRMAGRFMAVAMLIAGLSAAQLLPFLQLLTHSNRDPNFGGSDWAMPIYGLGTFLVPLFHAFRGVYGTYFQHDQYWTSSYYLGAGVVALALVAAWRVRERRVWVLSGAVTLALLLALGPVYSGVKAVLPQLGFMRYPIKFVVIPVFAIPLLAAYAVKYFRAEWKNAAREKSAIWGTTALLLALMGSIGWLAWKFPMVSDDWRATIRNALERAAFLVLAPALLLALRRAMASNLQVILRLAILAVLWLDVLTHAPNLNTSVARGVYNPGLVRERAPMDPQPRPGGPRLMETMAAINAIHSTALDKPIDDVLCRRVAFYDNLNLLDDVPKVDGFFSMTPRETQEVLGQLYGADKIGIDLRGLKDFLGVAQINATNIAPGGFLNWVARDTWLPLVTGGQKPVFVNDTNALKVVTAKDFDPRSIVYLPQESKSSIKVEQATPIKILPERFSLNRLTVQVEAAAPAMVVVAQSYFSPWHAYVDGQRVELLRANHAFQALEVPAGHHEVKLVYEDRIFEIGVAISVFTLLLLAAGCLREQRNNTFAAS